MEIQCIDYKLSFFIVRKAHYLTAKGTECMLHNIIHPEESDGIRIVLNYEINNRYKKIESKYNSKIKLANSINKSPVCK